MIRPRYGKTELSTLDLDGHCTMVKILHIWEGLVSGRSNRHNELS